MIGLLAFAAVVAGFCPLEDARYSLRTAPSVTAYFSKTRPGAKWPYDVAFATVFGATGRTFWWVPVPGGTNDLQFLQSTIDVKSSDWRSPAEYAKSPKPLGEMEFISTDQNYNIVDELPKAGGPAPAHILVTALGDAMWHGLFIIDGTRESAPKQFFDLIECSKR